MTSLSLLTIMNNPAYKNTPNGNNNSIYAYILNNPDLLYDKHSDKLTDQITKFISYSPGRQYESTENLVNLLNLIKNKLAIAEINFKEINIDPIVILTYSSKISGKLLLLK